MRDDHRFDRYLSVRASGIDLPPASITSVIDRAARRHRHRRAAVSACTAVAVLTAAVSVSNLDGSPANEQVVARSGAGTLVDSSLGWTVVTPKSGLSWSRSTVVGPSDTIYSLSTAPGAVASENVALPATLYRSTDGVEWTPAELPANLNPSSLAATDSALYAIGTAPAGGNLRTVQLASTNTTGGPWSKATLPLDVGALEARYGVKIGLGRLTVASDGTRVVVAARLQVVDGLDGLLPSVDTTNGYRVSEQGIAVYSNEMPDIPRTTTPDGKPDAPKRVEPTITAFYTWEQLRVDEPLRSLILGESRVFVADDGHTFSEAKLPTTVRLFGGLFVTADGFRLFGSTDSSSSQIDAWRSTDGRSWTADAGGPTAGYLLASGVRQGRVALVSAIEQVSNEQGSGPRSLQDVLVKMEQTDGSWSEFGVTDLLHRAGLDGEFYPAGAPAVGPLGVAVVVSEQRGDDTQRSYLVTTSDGIEASVIELAPLLDGGYPGDVQVTADAITVTVTGPAANGPVRLVVGTPRR